MLPELDTLMAGAWPPATVEHFDEWTFRYTSGVTRRANSVLALGQPENLTAAVRAAEAFYARHNAKPTFMFSEASSTVGLEALLLERGYVASGRTGVLWARTATALAALRSEYKGHFTAADAPGDEWFDTYWEVESAKRFDDSAAPILRQRLLRPKAQAIFVSAMAAGSLESVGQVVIDNGWGCIQCLATAPSARRKGAGSAVVHRLIVEARTARADRVFAAVVAGNEASLKLFERASFELSHQYCYFSPGTPTKPT